MLDTSTVDSSVEIDTVQETPESTIEVPVAIEEVDSTGSQSEENEQITEEVEFDSDSEDAEVVESQIREFSFGGSKLSVSADSVTDEIADELQKYSNNIQADYTRGKQEISDTRKSLEIKEKSLSNMSTLNDETLGAYSVGLRLREEIQQLSQVNVNELWQSNPDQARQVSDALGRKHAEFQDIVSKVGQQEHALGQLQQEEVKRRYDEGVTILDRKYKNFSTEKAPKLVEYAISKGMSQSEAKNWPLNPLVAEMAHKAMLYDDMQKKVNVRAKPKQVVAPVKATKTKGRATSGVKNLEKMSMDEYAKYRQK